MVRNGINFPKLSGSFGTQASIALALITNFVLIISEEMHSFPNFRSDSSITRIFRNILEVILMGEFLSLFKIKR